MDENKKTNLLDKPSSDFTLRDSLKIQGAVIGLSAVAGLLGYGAVTIWEKIDERRYQKKLNEFPQSFNEMP